MKETTFNTTQFRQLKDYGQELGSDLKEKQVKLTGRVNTSHQEWLEQLDTQLHQTLDLDGLSPEQQTVITNNQEQIYALAKELGMEEKEFKSSFMKGLQVYGLAELRTSAKTNPKIDPESSSREKVIGLYTLKVRSFLKDLKRLQEKNITFTPDEITFLLTKLHNFDWHILLHLFHSYPKVDESVIKYFVKNNPTNPEAAITKYLQTVAELKSKYGDEVDESTIKTFARFNPTNPEAAITKYLQTVAELKSKYGDEVDEGVIKHFALGNHTDPEAAITKYLQTVAELKSKYGAEVDESTIKYFALLNPTNPEAAIKRFQEQSTRALVDYRDLIEAKIITPGILRRLILHCPRKYLQILDQLCAQQITPEQVVQLAETEDSEEAELDDWR